MSDRLDEIAARLYTLDISTAANWIESQEECIRELEEVLRQVRSEYIGIPYAQWSTTMHRVNDIQEPPR